MNIEVKTINLKDSYNYVKDTLYILNKNILMTILFFILFFVTIYVENFSISSLKYPLTSLTNFVAFILCAIIYTGNISFYKSNKVPLTFCLKYSFIMFAIVILFFTMINFFNNPSEQVEPTHLELNIFAKYFIQSLSLSLIIMLTYYVFFTLYLLFFITKSWKTIELFIPILKINFKVFFISYLLFSLLFNLVYFYFKSDNQTINIFMNNFYYSFSALFTFIALNDILGLSKVQRKIKDKVYNKNLKIT